MLRMHRLRLAEGLLWIALLTPLALSTNGPSRTQADILSDPLAGTAAIRGGLPVVCLLLALIMVRLRLRPLAPLEKIVVIYLVVVGLSVAWSVVPFATALRAVTIVVAYSSIFVLVRLHEQRQHNSLESVSFLVRALLILVAVEGLMLHSRAFVSLSTYDPSLRLSGVFPDIHPDFVGLFAAIGLVFLIRLPGKWKSNYIRFGMAALYLGVMVLTRTRAAWLLLAVGLVMVVPNAWWTQVTRRRVIFPVALLVAAAIGAAVIGHSALTHYVLRDQSVGDLISLTGRTTTWGHAFSQWQLRPLTGFGYYSGHRFTIGEVADLDNMWLQTLLDLGLPGLVSLLVLICAAGATLWFQKGLRDPHIAVRRAVFVMGVLSSFVNPSLESTTYGQLVLGLVILGAPRLLMSAPDKGADQQDRGAVPAEPVA